MFILVNNKVVFRIEIPLLNKIKNQIFVVVNRLNVEISRKDKKIILGNSLLPVMFNG
jgi:hypothetical protein